MPANVQTARRRTSGDSFALTTAESASTDLSCIFRNSAVARRWTKRRGSIRETVRRVTAASLRAAAASDVLISAEDIAQETMATLHVQRDREPPESLLAWALGVARLKLQAALRRSHRRGLPAPLAYEDLAGAARSDEQVLELLHYVWLLDHLSPLDRMIVQGRQAGYTSRELARELQHIGYPPMTANNVDQRFYRALKSLRRSITTDQAAE